MEQEVFRAGVRPGGPTTGDEIKILICFILTEIDTPMSFEHIHEALLERELVNYFDLVSAWDSLERTGHIKAATEEANQTAPLYGITELGRSIAATVNNMLPKSIRDKAVDSAKKLLGREKRKREVTVEITKPDEGFEVKLAIPDSSSNLVSFTVFCPTEEEANLVRRRFLNDPAYIYRGVLALLTGDKNIIGEIFESGEELF